ncbi:hemolysin family protein [Sulfurihydrogenibium subterraneum]|uniref:hemolysin family protein n=1 Tax=Sulfurihydrogenibium subterraneum TaxID=171121 RepID=UPI00048A7FBF|nr:hemolysin family protein [Sulfurihydrogenibium subterraneum]
MFSYIVLIILFVFFEALFSGSEIALFSVNKTKLKYRASEGNKKAEKVYNLLEKYYNQYIYVGLVGTILSITLATSTFVAMLHDMSVIFPILKSKEEIFAEAIVIITLLFGEIIPKSVFQHYADELIYLIVEFLDFFRKVFKPFLWFAEGVNKVVFFLFRLKSKQEKYYTKEELLDLLLQIEYIDELKKKIIGNILIFSERRISEIVIPLSDVVAVADDKKVMEVVPVFKESGYTRIPVYRKRIDQIIGFVRSYDLLFAKPNDPITKYIKGIRYIPEFTSLPNVLKGFKHYRDHIAVVVDERGATIGIITLRDVLEEIVGEIKDDFVKKEKPKLKRQSVDEIVVDGLMEVKELKTLIDIDLPAGNYETVNGMITYILGRMPKKNEVIYIGDYQFEVLKIEKRRVLEVKIKKIKQS